MNKNNIPKSILEEIDKVADGSINNAMEVSKSLDNWIIGAVVGLFTADEFARQLPYMRSQMRLKKTRNS
jgi:hypothetical protein